MLREFFSCCEEFFQLGFVVAGHAASNPGSVEIHPKLSEMSVGFKFKLTISLSGEKGICTGLVLPFGSICLATPGAQTIKKDLCITDYHFFRTVGKFAIQHLTQPNNFWYVF